MTNVPFPAEKLRDFKKLSGTDSASRRGNVCSLAAFDDLTDRKPYGEYYFKSV